MAGFFFYLVSLFDVSISVFSGRKEKRQRRLKKIIIKILKEKRGHSR